MSTKKVLLSVFCTLLSVASFAGDEWEQRADFAGLGRHRACATAIGNMGYLGLGHFNGTGVETYFADWWQYDPATNSWTQKADFIGNGGLGELGAHTLQFDTVAFVGLGELDPQSLYKYSPATNSWVFVSDPPGGPSFRDTKSFVIDDKAYFTRLWSPMFYEYNMSTNIWTILGDMPFDGYFSYSAFSIGNKGYIKRYDELWEYDPALDNWIARDSFPGTARLSSLAVVQNGKGYIICGYGSTISEVVSEVWEYDPLSDSWSQLEDFPGNSRRYSSEFNMGNRAFLGTGTNGTNFSDFWEFTKGAGIDESSMIDVQVYPNPTSDIVHITSDHSDQFRVKLYSQQGAMIREAQSHHGEITLTISELTAGNYLYHIYIGEEVASSGSIVKK